MSYREDMTVMEDAGETELLKVDGRGRVRVPRERQEALLAEYDRSGMRGWSSRGGPG